MVFAAAVREAEAAKVSGALLAEADAWLGRMAAQREACQLCLVHFLSGSMLSTAGKRGKRHCFHSEW